MLIPQSRFMTVCYNVGAYVFSILNYFGWFDSIVIKKMTEDDIDFEINLTAAFIVTGLFTITYTPIMIFLMIVQHIITVVVLFVILFISLMCIWGLFHRSVRKSYGRE